MKRIISILAMLSLILAAAFAQSTDGTRSIVKSTLTNNGGGTISDGTLSVTGAIGQVDAFVESNDGTLKINGGFWTPESLAPTAAPVMISGRIKTANGRGIRNVVITLQDAATSETRRILSSTFGYYRFSDVEIGKIYVLTVKSKRYVFTQNSRIVSPAEDLTGEDFVADKND